MRLFVAFARFCVSTLNSRPRLPLKPASRGQSRNGEAKHAHRLLTDPRLSEQTLTPIAFAVGFNDFSHFHRRFRCRYGAPPSELRAQKHRSLNDYPNRKSFAVS